MSRIFDNIQQKLLAALRATLEVSHRADFCIGYLNLRGWQAIDDLISSWDPSSGQVCRVLVDMQRPPQDEIRELYRQTSEARFVGISSIVTMNFAMGLNASIWTWWLTISP